MLHFQPLLFPGLQIIHSSDSAMTQAIQNAAAGDVLIILNRLSILTVPLNNTLRAMTSTEQFGRKSSVVHRKALSNSG